MTNTVEVKQDWSWVARFVAVIVVSLILAEAIGSMELFDKTFVIPGKLSAAHLVHFLGYSTALGALWMLGRQATTVLQQQGGRWTFMQHLILPVVSLIVVSSSNSVALLVLKPMMNASLHNLYNWVYIVAILGCAVWVIKAVLGQSASLTASFNSVTDSIDALGKVKMCLSCGTSNDGTAKFCKECSKKLVDIA